MPCPRASQAGGPSQAGWLGLDLEGGVCLLFSERLGPLPIRWVGAEPRANQKAPEKRESPMRRVPQGKEQDVDLCTQ